MSNADEKGPNDLFTRLLEGMKRFDFVMSVERITVSLEPEPAEARRQLATRGFREVVAAWEAQYAPFDGTTRQSERTCDTPTTIGRDLSSVSSNFALDQAQWVRNRQSSFRNRAQWTGWHDQDPDGPGFRRRKYQFVSATPRRGCPCPVLLSCPRARWTT